MTDLTRTTPAELQALHGMGPKAIRMLADALALQGLLFRSNRAPIKGTEHVIRSSALSP